MPVAAKPIAKGRKPVDPDGFTKALTVRLPAALKLEIEEAAAANTRSVSQEIVARLGRPGMPAQPSPLAQLVDAFAPYTAVFYGTDWKDRDAATALAAGVTELMRRLAPAGSEQNTKASQTGVTMAEMFLGHVMADRKKEFSALRAAFIGNQS